jgi:hypothetical protein
VTATLVVAAVKAVGLATVMVSAAVLAVEHKTVVAGAVSAAEQS